MKTKRLLFLLAATCMLIWFLPLTALAADPPALIGASVTPSGHVELTFDKPMAAPEAGAAGFAVTGLFGQNKNVQSATLQTDTTKILLTLGITVKGGETGSDLFFTYTPGTVHSADNEPLALTSGWVENLLPHPTLDTTSLADGTIGVPYSYTFTATGGTTPYAFYVLYGTLPPGLVLNGSTGVLSGTPSAAGMYGFDPYLRIMVLDANQAVAIRNITIVINGTTNGNENPTPTQPLTQLPSPDPYPSPADIPETGDNSLNRLGLLLFGAFAACVALLAGFGKRRTSRK